MAQFSLPHDLLAELDLVDGIVRDRLAARAAVLQLIGQPATSEATRIRAALTLLGAQLGPQRNADAARHAAATVELIYAASQVHNSLMDDVARRSTPATGGNQLQNDVSLMVGDYLFALAASEMALTPDPRIIAFLSQAVMAVCEGQLMPVTMLAPLHDAHEQYMAHAGSITAALFRAACQAGMVCGGGTDAQIDALGEYGRLFGLAYRISTELRAQAAEPNNAHIRRITLPLIYAAATLPDVAAAADGMEQATAALQHSDATQRAMADAQSMVEQATNALAVFPDSPTRQTLIDVARAVLRPS